MFGVSFLMKQKDKSCNSLRKIHLLKMYFSNEAVSYCFSYNYKKCKFSNEAKN